MKRKSLVLLFLFVIAIPILVVSVNAQQKQTIAYDYSDYKLVFSDEFNLPNGSQPDGKVWSRAKRYDSMWNRWISNSKDVVFIKDGKLICRAIPNKSEKNDTAKMLTGAIESIGKFSFMYGRVDVRLKTNNKRGNFPAAWMKPEKIDKNRYGEIDIFESFGHQGIAHQTIHNHETAVLGRKAKNKFEEKVSLNKWHVYSLIWTPTQLVFLIDGRETGRFDKSKDAAKLKDGQWTFDRPFYLLLNQSVGDGRFDYLVPNTHTVYETQFDWIRVYQKR